MVEAGEAVTRTYLDAGTWTVEINGREYPARASSAPLYDPTNERIRG
jgi:4-methylaminobutanoate oxidase (formaldehyde-forming)